jgi:hypothetical protein
MQLPRAVTKVALPGLPVTDGGSSNVPARRAAMRPSLLAVDLAVAPIADWPAFRSGAAHERAERETWCQASRCFLPRARGGRRLAVMVTLART